MEMEFEYELESYIDKIKHVDIYLRNTYDKYNSLTLFIDENNFSLYNDIDDKYMINNTRNMIIKVISKIKNSKKKLFYICIVCYVINIKYYSDCYFNKPYTFILEMLSEFDDISFLNKKNYLKNMIKIEREMIPFLCDIGDIKI